MRRLVVLAALVAATLAVGCTSSIHNGVKSEQGLIDLCQEEVALLLKDPYSAQYEDIQVFEGSGWLVTGKMNAKNGMGGYTGFAPFRCEIFKDAVSGEPDSVIAIWYGH